MNTLSTFRIIILYIVSVTCLCSSCVIINAQEVVNYKVHNCFGGTAYNVNNRIKSNNVKNDTLFVELQLVVNCAMDSTDQLNFKWISNDTLLFNFTPTAKSEQCCLCDLQVDLSILNYKNPDIVFMYINEYLNVSPYFANEFPIMFDIYKGDTINYVNKYGYPEGAHIEFSDNGKKDIEKFYVDGRIIWVKLYNYKGKLDEFCLRNGYEDECYSRKEYKKLFKKKY